VEGLSAKGRDNKILAVSPQHATMVEADHRQRAGGEAAMGTTL
jgi:hypothetical protein